MKTTSAPPSFSKNDVDVYEYKRTPGYAPVLSLSKAITWSSGHVSRFKCERSRDRISVDPFFFLNTFFFY